MPVIPNFMERLILLKLNLGPGPMLDFLGALAFRTVIVAHRLGVFETLSGGPRMAAEVARQIEADERGTILLLEALEALGYVKKKDGRYAATAMTVKWLPVLGDGIGFFEMLLERFQDLDESIRRGGPAIDARDWLDQRPDGWREFEAGMIA